MAKEYIVLLGAPGAGKGTQAQMMQESLNIPALSTGAILREAMQAGTDVGIEAKKYINAGNLVPDEIVVNIVAERILQEDCKNGFILDGFPRTISQAKSLDKMLKKYNLALTHVISIEVDEAEIVARRGGRLMAPKSGRVYHEINNPPKIAGKCDITGENLVKREDDKEEVVRHRLQVYAEQTAPVKDYYAEQDMIIEINGMQGVKEVADNIMSEISQTAAA